MRYSYSFSAKMDEHMEPEMETEQDREPDQDPSLAEILSCFFYPTLGILKGLVYTGFEEVTEEIITAMWEFAPAEMWKRISVVT